MRFSLLLFPVALTLHLAGCSKCDDPCNKECDNYDPCCEVSSVSAEFRVRPGDRGFAPPGEWCNLLPTDTFNSSSVRFDILLGNPETSTYEWRIGTEQDSRTQHSFEISFHDYLSQGNWESSIPVTLTVRTPLNACWDKPEDTLITMTRELFFTQNNIYNSFLVSDSIITYKGFYSGGHKESTLTYYSSNKPFRGQTPPLLLIIGTPIMDTLMSPKLNCGADFCFNYFHAKAIFHNVENCSFSPLTNYMTGYERIFLAREEEVKSVFHFLDGSKLDFIGTKQ